MKRISHRYHLMKPGEALKDPTKRSLVPDHKIAGQNAAIEPIVLCLSGLNTNGGRAKTLQLTMVKWIDRMPVENSTLAPPVENSAPKKRRNRDSFLGRG